MSSLKPLPETRGRIWGDLLAFEDILSLAQSPPCWLKFCRAWVKGTALCPGLSWVGAWPTLYSESLFLVIAVLFPSLLCRLTGRLEVQGNIPIFPYFHGLHGRKTADSPSISYFLRTLPCFSLNTSFPPLAAMNVTLCCYVLPLESGYHKGRGCPICAWCMVHGHQLNTGLGHTWLNSRYMGKAPRNDVNV